MEIVFRATLAIAKRSISIQTNKVYQLRSNNKANKGCQLKSIQTNKVCQLNSIQTNKVCQLKSLQTIEKFFISDLTNC